MSDIIFVKDGLGHFIKDNILKVPPYQRPYSWEKEDINALFEDIDDSNGSEYFIGSIVIKENGNAFEIIDGQQRIATLYIFYVALRDFLKNKNDDYWQDIQRDYIAVKNKRTRELEQKLELAGTDNEFFRKEFIEQGSDGKAPKSSKRQSNSRLQDAYDICKRKVEKLFNQSNSKADRLMDYIDYLHDKLVVITVNVPNESNAFTIFETLNYRGVTLSKTDLIKNYLFNKSGKRIGEATVKWEKIGAGIEYALGEEDDVIDFIRYQWSSKKGLTREKDLFESIRTSIKTPNGVIEYLDELESDMKLYIALATDSSYWNSYSANCSDYIKAIKDLGVIQNRPLLLAMLRKFKKGDVEKALKLVVSWTVRNLITGTTSAGLLEKEFSNQAKLISDEVIKIPSDLKKSIINLVPTDENFKNAFAIVNVSKSILARYYLSEIEKTYQKNEEKITNKNTEVVNLEHILPEKADFKKDWTNWTEDNHKAFYKRLGNLTLMDKGVNSEQKSNRFEDKKPFYKSSGINMTKKLSAFKSWDLDSINKRQKELAEKAVIVWNLKL